MISDERREQIEAKARRVRMVAIGALVGFSACAALILLLRLFFPIVASPDFMLLRAALLTTSTTVAMAWGWYRSGAPEQRSDDE